MPVNTFTRDTIHGTKIKMEEGCITGDVEDYFSNGQCHALAYVLHQKLALPMVWLEHALYGEIVHCAVQLPDGDYLDIRGVQGPETHGFIPHMAEDPKGFIDLCRSDASIEDKDGWMKPDLYLARRYANILIDQYSHDIAISMCA